MSDVIPPGDSRSYSFEFGKPGTVSVNRPCRFEIVTSAGSKIEGLITPNNPLIVTPFGDLDSVKVYVEDVKYIQPPKS